MGFKREWDSSYPRVWDQWEADGKAWVIQDLPPEDDEKALELLVYDLARDEELCRQSKLLDDPESVEGISAVWRESLAKRTSLACYTEVDGKKTLVALNCCMVACRDNHEHPEIKGKAWKNVYGVIAWMEEQCDPFEYLGEEKHLTALGLSVKKEFRGARLGARLLNAREKLCKHLGIRGTVTVFTGPASQKLAARCGFTTILETTWKELADAGLDYPRVDKVCKLKIKKYQ